MNDIFVDANKIAAGKIIRNIAIVIAIILFLLWLSPFNTVPTGMRGVITQFGAIKGIEPEGLVVLPPWQKLSVFNVRAEEATIENSTQCEQY